MKTLCKGGGGNVENLPRSCKLSLKSKYHTPKEYDAWVPLTFVNFTVAYWRMCFMVIDFGFMLVLRRAIDFSALWR